MSESNRVALRYAVESVWNQIPVAALTNIRYTSESLNYNINTIVSEEIRDDRQVPDVVQVDADVVGDINYELSYSAHETFMEGALFNAFGSAASFSAATVSVANSDNSFNDSGSGFPNLSPGRVIKVGGFNNSANNGFFIVVSRTTSKIVVAGNALITESAGNTVTIDGKNLRNGTTRKSFVLEKQFSDKSGEFLAFTGNVVNSMNMSLATGQMVSGTFNFLGASAATGSSTVGTGGPTAAPTNDVVNAVSNLARLLEGDAVLTGIYVQSLNFTVENNLRGIKAIGVLGNADIAAGRMDVKGNITVYFEDGSRYEKYLNNTPSSILWAVQDSSGQGYAIYLPQVKYTAATVEAGGTDTDVLVSLDFTAYLDPTYGFTVQVDAFPGT